MHHYLIFVLLLNCVYSNKVYSIENDAICSRNQTSCSYMFGQQFPLDLCQKIIYDANETASCKAAYNDDDSTINKNTYLGKLTLFPFYGGIRTNFNVTFTDIQFKLLRIYFQGLFAPVTQPNCMVKEFIWNGTVPSDKSFSYTCPWTSEYEGKDLEFHYDYGIEQYETRKKFVFKVPHNQDLRNKNIGFFPYVDHTNLGNLILHLHPLSNKLNITKYKVDFVYSYYDQETIKSTVNLTAVNNSHYFYTSESGEYYFRIEPISDYCFTNKNACVIQETPKIRIEPVSSFLIGMVGVSLLIPIFMIIVYMLTKHWPGLPRKRCETNVLLVTVPTNDAHVTVAPAFADFLQETFHVNVLLDMNKLPSDSYAWLKTAIHNKATHIMYLRSDDKLSANKVIYQDIYLETITLLKPKYNKKKIKECIISFPYSSATTEFSHPELVHLIKKRNFTFDRKIRKITKFLINRKVSSRNINNSTYQKLLEAVQGVVDEASVRKSQRNIDVTVPPVPEEDDSYPKETNDEEPVKHHIDLSGFSLLGEQSEQISVNEEKFSDDSEDDSAFLGNL